jgi:hypothetical protein
VRVGDRDFPVHRPALHTNGLVTQADLTLDRPLADLGVDPHAATLDLLGADF